MKLNFIISVIFALLIANVVAIAAESAEDKRKTLGVLDPKTGLYTTVEFDQKADVMKETYKNSEGKVEYVLEYKDISKGKKYVKQIDEKTGKPVIIASDPEPFIPKAAVRTTQVTDPNTGDTIITYYDADDKIIKSDRVKIIIGDIAKKEVGKPMPEPFRGVWICLQRGDYIILDGNTIDHNGIKETCMWNHALLKYANVKPTTFESLSRQDDSPKEKPVVSGAVGNAVVGPKLSFESVHVLSDGMDRFRATYTEKKRGSTRMLDYERGKPCKSKDELEGMLWFNIDKAFKFGLNNILTDYQDKEIGRYKFAGNGDEISQVTIESEGEEIVLNLYYSDKCLLLLGDSEYRGVYETLVSRYENGNFTRDDNWVVEDIFKYIEDRDKNKLLSIMSKADSNWNSYKNKYNQTPSMAMAAMINWDREILKYSITHGADFFEKNSSGVVGFAFSACDFNSFDLENSMKKVAMFIYSNPKANWQDAMGRKILFIKELKILKFLVSMGLDVNTKYENQTLLQSLTREGCKESVEFLIQNGAVK